MSSFIDPCADIVYGQDRAVVHLDGEQMILGEESVGELAHSLLQYGDISAELRGELVPQIDNLR